MQNIRCTILICTLFLQTHVKLNYDTSYKYISFKRQQPILYHLLINKYNFLLDLQVIRCTYYYNNGSTHILQYFNPKFKSFMFTTNS